MIQFNVGRIYFRQNQVVSFHQTVGANYWYLLTNIGQSPGHLIKGHVTGEAIDVTGFRMWMQTNSTSADLQFKTWVIRQRRKSHSTTVDNQIFKSEVFTPKHLGPIEIKFDIDDMACEPGDLISLAFERIGTGGNWQYIGYPDAVTIETRQP